MAEPAAKMAELYLRDLGAVQYGLRGGTELSLKYRVRGFPLEAKEGRRDEEPKHPYWHQIISSRKDAWGRIGHLAL